MKKTILAFSILSAISLNAQANLSSDDLMDINSILGETPTTQGKEAPKEEPKKTEKPDNKSSPKVESKEKTTPKETKPVTTKTVETKKSTETVKPPVNEPVKPTLPTIVVPVAGTDFIVNVDRYKKSILKKVLSKDEMKLSMIDKVADEYKNETEIVEFVNSVNVNKINALNNMVTEPNVFAGVSSIVKDGKIEKKEQLADLKYGYTYILQIKDYDKKNNRVRLQIDYTNSDIDSYEEAEIKGNDGVQQKVKIPSIKAANTSKLFWLVLETGSTSTIKVDDKNYIDVSIGRVMPFVKPVVVVDKKKMEADRLAEIAAKKKAVEDAKAAKIKEDNDLYDSLENDLKGKNVKTK